jgi:hypothetical protein
VTPAGPGLVSFVGPIPPSHLLTRVSTCDESCLQTWGDVKTKGPI